jgi:hypothetical protein
MKVWFASFWGKFDVYDNVFTYALSQKYNVEVTPDNPDIVISNHFVERYQNAKMIYFSGEPFYDIGVNDYALTPFYIDEPNYFRFPLYLLYAYEYYKCGYTNSYDEILYKKSYIDRSVLDDKSAFCSYVARGAGHPECRRTPFFEKLNEYKFVASMGDHLRNTEPIPGESGTIMGSINKCEILKYFKFNMAFENSMEYNGKIGYATEKIYEPMIALSIPIYWGNPEVHKDFNTKSFINWNDYGSDEKVIERIIEIDNDDDLYMDYMKENYFANDELFKIDYLVNIFEEILK